MTYRGGSVQFDIGDDLYQITVVRPNEGHRRRSLPGELPGVVAGMAGALHSFRRTGGPVPVQPDAATILACISWRPMAPTCGASSC